MAKTTNTTSSNAAHDALVASMLAAINGNAPAVKANSLRNKVTAFATDTAATLLDTTGAVAGASLAAWENGKTSFKAEVAFRAAQREVRKVELAEYYAQRLAGKL